MDDEDYEVTKDFMICNVINWDAVRNVSGTCSGLGGR